MENMADSKVIREQVLQTEEETLKQQQKQSEQASTIEDGLSKLKSTLNSLENASSENTGANAKACNKQAGKKDDHDKESKTKAKKSRELEDLEDNLILPSRLRSDSGNIYSSSMIIDAARNRPDSIQSRQEQELQSIFEEQESEMRPCSEGQCCRNTTTIVNLIEKLQKTVDSIQSENKSQISVNAQIGNDMRELEGRMDESDKTIESLERELDDYKFQMKLIANVVIRQDQQIANLTKKVNDAQQREMYPNLVITGIPEKQNENTLKSYNEFVQNELEIQEMIPAHRAFRVGSGRNRPMIVELRDPIIQKGKIYSKVGNLKGKRNAEGGRFFVSDHLPEEYNETRRRANELIAENKKKKSEDKLSMTIK